MYETNSIYEGLDVNPYLVDGTTKMYTGDYAGAESLFLEGLTEYPDDSILLDRLGVLYTRMHKHEKAGEYFRKAYSLNPQDAYNLCNLGNYCLKILKDTKQAESFFLEALEIEPRNAAALHQLGFMYAKLDRREEAEEYLRRLIEVDKRQVLAYFKLGVIYKHLGRDEEAIEMFRACYARKHDDVPSRCQLGMLYQKRGEYEEAERLFWRCVALEPENSYALHQLSLLYIEAKRYDKAEAVLERILTICHSDVAMKRLCEIQKARKEGKLETTVKEEAVPVITRIRHKTQDNTGVRKITGRNSDKFTGLMCSIPN